MHCHKHLENPQHGFMAGNFDVYLRMRSVTKKQMYSPGYVLIVQNVITLICYLESW